MQLLVTQRHAILVIPAGSLQTLHTEFKMIGHFRSVPKMWRNCEAEFKFSVITNISFLNMMFMSDCR